MGKGESVRPTVGWREWVSLPDIGIDRIKGKIDTGARTSALHAVDLHQYFDEGVLRIRFRVYPVQRDSTSHLTCDAEVIDERSVKISLCEFKSSSSASTMLEIASPITRRLRSGCSIMHRFA